MKTQLDYPGLIRRLMIVVYDSLIYAALIMVTVAVAVAVASVIDMEYVKQNPGAVGKNPLTFLAMVLVCFLYYGGSLVKRGQTMAMIAWHVKVVGLDQRPLTWNQVVIRFFTSFAGLANLSMFFNPTRRGWQDMASNSLQLLTKEKSPKDKDKQK